MEITITSLIPERARAQYIPLSFSHELYRFNKGLDDSIKNHISFVLYLKGDLNREGLANALTQIVNRQEVLRTVILENEGVLYQHVMPKDGFVFSVIEGTAYEKDSEDLQKQIQQIISEPFDLSKDHLLRVALIKIKDDEHYLVVTMHPAAADEDSVTIFFHELSEFYNSQKENRPVELNTLQFQYADYSIWQRNYLQGPVLETSLNYWKEYLKGLEIVELPIDRNKVTTQYIRGVSNSVSFDELLLPRLQELGREQDISLSAILLSAFKVLLFRYSGQNDICVVNQVPARKQPGTECLVGSFPNKLAIRTNINGDDSFIELLKMVAASLNNAIEHKDLPLEKLINSLTATQDNISPLFRFIFGFRGKTCKCKRSLNELELSVSRHENTYDQSGLSLIITETDQGLFGSITYNANLSNSEDIDLMIAHYIELLHSIINQPEQKIGALPMVTAGEAKKLLVDFNDTYSAFPKSKSLVEVFEEMVEINPGNIAVVFGTDKLTYRELSERSNQLAHYLRKKGVKENTLVPICIRRSVELIVGILGVLKCGAAYVPIDPEYPLERINYILKDSSNGILICNSEYKSKLKTAERTQLIEIDSEWSRMLDEPKTNLPVIILPGALAYIIYTSGSTGIPKGAMIEHSNIVSLVKGVNYVNLTEKEIVLSTGSPSFDATTFEYWGVLLNGGKLVLCSENTLLDISLLKAAIRSHEITMMWFTSSWFNQLVDFDITIFETLQTVLVGGEKLSEEHIRKFRKAFPAIEIINGYGPTENTTFSLTYSIGENDIKSAIPIGTPLNNRTVYLVNEFGQLVPIGFPGEILLGGAGVGRGYLNQAELTAQKFIPNPFNSEPGERLYKSGDLGKWLPNGTVAYLGRLDGQVKIRGYRIELGEIEIAMNGLSEVNSSYVVVKDDINSTKKMVAYYIPDQSVLKIKEHELYLQLVASWKELYEIEYAKTEVSEDINPEFNIIGWNDSFTGKPIPAEYMQEWLKDIMEVIVNEEPGNVLEIGCGTGLIYYQLAGKVKKYTGTDFSRSSINQISERIGKGLKDYGPTELFVCPAHEISLSEAGKPDTIILNSIIQYFPGEDYLTDVIAKSLSLLSGHGRIIIGDVRDNRLLHLFKGRLLLNKLVESGKSMKTKDFNWTMNQEALKEEELCVSPDYFYSLKSVFPEISHIEIKWKQGSYLNELSLYRFTVVIYVGTGEQSFKPNWQHWNDIDDKQVIISQLHKENIIAIKDVPNPRLWQERLLTIGLQDNSISSTSDLSKLMSDEDIEMVQLKDILTQLVAGDYTCRFLMHEDKFKMNLVITPKSSNLLVEEPYNIKTAGAGILFTNIPLFNDIRYMLQKEIRVALQQSLPEFMIPAEFIALNYLPLNKNGKVDRSFLSLLEDTASSNIVNFKNPETKEQIELAAIWKELFNRERISLEDDFFELGGHSLLAMRLVVEINKQLQVNISMNDLFRNPSLSDLALYIQAQKNKVNASSNNHASLLPIKPGIKKVPLYMVCGGGGTVFKFKDFADMLDENQPVYGLQQPIEIKNLKEFPDTIEGIAAKYIEEIINQNPDGPYALSGHCLGGIIAFEMAKQMEARGKEVKLLVMFDTVIGEVVKPDTPSIKNLYNIPLIVKKLISKLALKIHFQTFLLRKYTKYSIGHKVQKVKSLAVFEGMYEAENLELKVFKKLEDIYLKAYKNYHITPYEKDIILFYAKEHYFFWDKENDVKFKRVTLDDQTKNQWKHFVKSITMYEVEGEHSTIFYRENAKEFAQLVQHHLDIGK